MKGKNPSAYFLKISINYRVGGGVLSNTGEENLSVFMKILLNMRYKKFYDGF
jgi:hypothetical protein